MFATVALYVYKPKSGPTWRYGVDAVSVTLTSAVVRSTGFVMAPEQFASVVMVVEPRYVWPWPYPEESADGFEKNSMVYFVFARLSNDPSRLTTFAVCVAGTALENSEVLPFGSVAVAVT